MTDPRTPPGDLALRRALAHAPDHAVVPGEELGRAILTFAHEAVAPSLPGATPGIFGRGRKRSHGSRRGRNTVLVALLIGVLAMVAWQRELMPGARPHADAPAAVPAAGEPSGAATQAPEASASPSAAASGVTANAPATGAAPAIASAPVPVPTTPPTTPAATPVPPPSAPVPAPRPPAMPKSPPVATMPSAAMPSPGPSSTGAPAERLATAPRTRADATPAAAPRTRADATPAAASTARTAETPPPTFVALSQWTHLTITRIGGESQTRARADVRELGALLGSAALAGVGPEALKGRVDWRIALHRNSETIARIELTGSQVRWRENGVPPGTGTPPPDALAGLRRMLDAVSAESTAAGAGAAATPAPAAATPSPAPQAPEGAR